MSTVTDDTPDARPGLRSVNPCGPVVELITTTGSHELGVLVYRSTAADQALCATPDQDPSPRLYGLALPLPGTPAEDLAPDFSLEVWRTSAVFDADRDNAMAWIMAIAYRRAVDRLRSAHHPTHPPPARSISPLGRRAARNARRLDRATSTEAHRVRDAFAELDRGQREALEVVYFDEDPTAEPRDLTAVLTTLVTTPVPQD